MVTEQPPAKADQPKEESSAPEVDRDWRAVAVTGAGFLAIAAVALIAIIAIPASVAADEISTKGDNVVAIAAAAFTAIGTLIAAYFGVKAANVAREEATKAAERSEIVATEIAAAAPGEVAVANQRATQHIRARGLQADRRRGGVRR